MNQQYLIVKEQEGFSPCWVVNQKQLFEFFLESVHDQIKIGVENLENKDDYSFFVETSCDRYLISIPIIPFYMDRSDHNND